MKKTTMYFAGLALAMIATMPTTALAGGGKNFSQSKPIWTFDAPPPPGKSNLVRARHGLFAKFKASGIPAGSAVTLWIMFFDNPEACLVPYGCTLQDDAEREGVRFDFHYAGARIVRGSRTIFWGYLPINELSTSGFAELGAPPTPLTNPKGAQVVTALHSHGPAQWGPVLYEQLTSYLGGCEMILGNANGFAESFSDIPANVGECSTIQLAFHNPPAPD